MYSTYSVVYITDILYNWIFTVVEMYRFVLVVNCSSSG